MEKAKKIRNRWLHIRMDEAEHKQLHEHFSRTTEDKLSRYARKILLAEPVMVIHRDGSMDALIAVLVKVQNDLNGVANNFNQMVHKLHMADTNQEIQRWILSYEKDRTSLLESIAEMRELITNGAKKWLR